jgi:hypothetical protein
LALCNEGIPLREMLGVRFQSSSSILAEIRIQVLGVTPILL